AQLLVGARSRLGFPVRLRDGCGVVRSTTPAKEHQTAERRVTGPRNDRPLQALTPGSDPAPEIGKPAARGVNAAGLPDCSPRPSWPGTHNRGSHRPVAGR